jgi:hypothetical protein
MKLIWKNVELYHNRLNKVLHKILVHLETKNVILSGKRVFVEAIIQRCWDEIILDFGWTLNPMAGVCTKRGHKIQRRWLLETGCIYKARNSEDWQKAPKVRREASSKEDGFFFGYSRSSKSCAHLDYRLVVTWVVREQVCCFEPTN